jgi:hypothetical protein
MTRDGDKEELGSVAALARLLPREVAPPPDLWENLAARLEPRGRLEGLAASLPMNVEPPADLWPKIAARISPGRRARRLAVAFAASIAVVVAAVVGLQFAERTEPASGRGSPSVAADDSASRGASAASSVGWVLGAPVAGDVAASLNRDLVLVRDERLTIERAIATEPDNVDLRELWAFTYATELELADACSRTVMEYERDRG